MNPVGVTRAEQSAANAPQSAGRSFLVPLKARFHNGTKKERLGAIAPGRLPVCILCRDSIRKSHRPAMANPVGAKTLQVYFEIYLSIVPMVSGIDGRKCSPKSTMIPSLSIRI